MNFNNNNDSEPIKLSHSSALSKGEGRGEENIKWKRYKPFKNYPKMKTSILKNIENDFLSSEHQSFDSIQHALKQEFDTVLIASKNGYKNILNANAWGDHLHNLTVEELFIMNLNDKEVLAILNLSIYQAIIQNDYSHLINGVFTYSRLRLLQRTHVSGTKDWIVVESMITNDKILKNLEYPKSITFNKDKSYDEVIVLAENLLKTIVTNPAFKMDAQKQYSELIGNVSSKFDNSFINYLYGLTTDNYELCKTSFEQMEQLYGRCQWLSRGWYEDAKLNTKGPIFLLGLYRLKNVSIANFEFDIKNEFLKKASNFIIENPEYKPSLCMSFNNELQFLNNILTENFATFYTNYQTKINAIKTAVKKPEIKKKFRFFNFRSKSN